MFKSDERLQKVLTLLFAWAILLALFFVYEAYFVEGQREFVSERGFRVLSALSNELDAEFEQAIASTESYLKLVALVQPEEGKTASPSFPNEAQSMVDALKECQQDASTHKCRYLDIYLKDIWTDDAAFDHGACRKNAEEDIPVESRLDDSRLILNLFCLKQQGQKSTLTQIITLNLAPWIQGAFQQLGGYFDDVVVADATGRVLFQEAEKGFTISDLRALAPPSDNSKTQPNSSPASGRIIPPAGASNTNEKPDVPEARWVRSLSQATTAATISVAGESYNLFSQPVYIHGNYPAGSGGVITLVVCGLRHANSFESEVHSVPYSTLIWAALIATTLFSLSWPLFKLQYMSNTERFRPRDGWYLILAIFLASSSMMLILLNASYSAQAQNEADAKMLRLAAQINSNVKVEFDQAHLQLQKFTAEPELAKDLQYPVHPYLVPDFFHTKNQSHDPAPCYPYFEIAFWADREGAQLLKYDVRSVTTPATKVDTLSFFKDSISDLDWSTGTGASKRNLPASAAATLLPPCGSPAPAIGPFDSVHLQPQFSPNTREFLVILATPVSLAKQTDEDIKETTKGSDPHPAAIVQALAIRPLSLVDPVMPPGYSFAVIDSECQVLFHSDSIRNLRENFCLESKNKSELKPWLFSGLESSLDITYAGRSERAYLTSFVLPGLSVGRSFLIVYQDPDENPSLNLAIILVCSILMGSYFLMPLAAACLHLSLRNPLRLTYAPRFIWPCKENARRYAPLFAANGVMVLLYWASYQRLYEAPMLLLTIAVALLGILFPFLRLEFSARALFNLGKGLTLISLSILAAILAVTAFGKELEVKFDLLSDWALVFALLATFGQIAVLLSGERSWIRWMFGRDRIFTRMEVFLSRQSAALRRLFSLGSRMERSVAAIALSHFRVAYALTVVSIITCVALVPSVGFFKYAYDAVTELSLKRDQIVFSESLVARRDRIRRYYETVALHAESIAEKRLNESCDRYDKAVEFFATTGEPALPTDPQSPAPRAGGSPQALSGCDTNSGPKANPTAVKPAPEPINDWIEKSIARATLTFPSNQLGREMSELGVASSGPEACSSSERCWDELAPRRFRLSWTEQSRIPNLTVTSSYAKWGGLQPWARLFLMAFWTVLVIWVLSIVKKIFVTDFEKEPVLKLVNWTSVQDIDNHFLVVGPGKSGKTSRLRGIKDLPENDWRDLRIELTRILENATYEKPRCQGTVLILDHFEFNITDRAYNRVRLELLENLLYESTCKVILVSTVDPLYFLTEGAPQVLTDGKNANEARTLLDRWARVLSRLTQVRLADSSRSEFEEKLLTLGKGTDRSRLVTWIREECGRTPFLHKVGLDLVDWFQARGKVGITRESIEETVLDRANSQYHVIWSSLTAVERLVLFQLALDGWANQRTPWPSSSSRRNCWFLKVRCTAS